MKAESKATAEAAGKGRRDQFRPAPIRELRDSLMLLVLVVSSMSAYVGIGFAAVRLFAGR